MAGLKVHDPNDNWDQLGIFPAHHAMFFVVLIFGNYHNSIDSFAHLLWNPQVSRRWVFRLEMAGGPWGADACSMIMSEFAMWLVPCFNGRMALNLLLWFTGYYRLYELYSSPYLAQISPSDPSAQAPQLEAMRSYQTRGCWECHLSKWWVGDGADGIGFPHYHDIIWYPWSRGMFLRLEHLRQDRVSTSARASHRLGRRPVFDRSCTYTKAARGENWPRWRVKCDVILSM